MEDPEFFTSSILHSLLGITYQIFLAGWHVPGNSHWTVICGCTTFIIYYLLFIVTRRWCFNIDKNLFRALTMKLALWLAIRSRLFERRYYLRTAIVGWHCPTWTFSAGKHKSYPSICPCSHRLRTISAHSLKKII